MTTDSILKLAEDAIKDTQSNTPSAQLREAARLLLELAEQAEGKAPREMLALIAAARSKLPKPAP